VGRKFPKIGNYGVRIAAEASKGRGAAFPACRNPFWQLPGGSLTNAIHTIGIVCHGEQIAVGCVKRTGSFHGAFHAPYTPNRSTHGTRVPVGLAELDPPYDHFPARSTLRITSA
jgi:hypothetical protein